MESTRGGLTAQTFTPRCSIPREETPLVAPTDIPTVVSITSVVSTVASVAGAISGVSAVTISVVTAIGVATNGEVNSIVNGSTLGNWHDDRLMIRSGGDGRHSVSTGGETLGDISGELATGSDTVETLEESKYAWVGGFCRVEGCDRFNNNVVVSDNLASVVQLLRRGVVSIGGIGEGAGLHSFDVHGDSEWGVRLDITTVGRELELDGRHVVDTGNITHRGGVARAGLNLLAICNGLADTEADEVVGADKGIRFASCLTLAIDVLNDGRVQREGGLGVDIPSATTVTGLGVITGVIPAIVSTVVPAIVSTTSATAKPIALTGYNTTRLRDEEGNGELGNSKENKRELEGLHGSCPDGSEGKLKRFWWGEMTVRIRSKLLCRKGREKKRKV